VHESIEKNLMDFIIDRVENTGIYDSEIFELLSEVFVTGGFTSLETAKSIFEPSKVKSRGVLFVSKEINTNEMAGMVIVVPWTSSFSVKAKENECEMHLLGVSKKFRGHGLGRRLVEEALNFSKGSDLKKMILWTQKPMREAQNLYESHGFTQCGEMARNGIDFLVYERECT